jgi:hypothetical protein
MLTRGICRKVDSGSVESESLGFPGTRRDHEAEGLQNGHLLLTDWLVAIDPFQHGDLGCCA